MAKLNAAARKKLPKSSFALPSTRSKSGGQGGYPIPDKSHARNALARVSQHGSAAQKKQVRAKVHAKFPDIKMGGNTRLDDDSMKAQMYSDRKDNLGEKNAFVDGVQRDENLQMDCDFDRGDY